MLVKLHRPPPEMRIFLPRRSACSSRATRRPRLPASMAHIKPAAPPPRINASKLWVTVEEITSAAKAANNIGRLFIAALKALRHPKSQRSKPQQSRLQHSRPHTQDQHSPKSHSHVKQAKAWQSVLFQQTFMYVLLLQLIDLRPRHFAAVGSEVAVGLSPNAYDFFVRSGREQRGEKFFFDYGQAALEIFQARRGFPFDFVREMAQGLGSIERDGVCGDSTSLQQLCTFQRVGISS